MTSPADPRRGARKPNASPKWGSVARRGARSIGLPDRPAVPGEAGHPKGPAPEWQPEEWRRTDEPAPRGRRPAARAPRAGATGKRGPVPAGVDRQKVARQRPDRQKIDRHEGDERTPRPRSKGASRISPEVSEAIAKKVKGRAASGIERRFAQAAEAFEHDRIPEAVRLLRPLASDHPDLAPVRELAGLALYRSGKWAEAARNLEAARMITGSFDQHPVLADCYRALRRYPLVEALWKELREASPEPAILTEGRIVAAGARADRGDLSGAIEMLEGAAGSKRARRGRAIPIWTVRLWYALADLYERSGDQPKARAMFTRVVAVEPDMADAAERLSNLT